MKSAKELVWKTSNMEYGMFYNITTEEDQRRMLGERKGHSECLTKSVINCRKQLGLMRLRDASAEPAEVGDGDCLTILRSSFAKKIAEYHDTSPPPAPESYFQAHLEKIRKFNKIDSKSKNCPCSDDQQEVNNSRQNSNQSFYDNAPTTYSQKHSKTLPQQDIYQTQKQNDQLMGDQLLGDQIMSDRTISDRLILSDRLMSDRVMSDRIILSDRLMSDRTTSDHITTGRTYSTEQTISDRSDPNGIAEDTKQLEFILNRLADKLQPFTDETEPIKPELKHKPVKRSKRRQRIGTRFSLKTSSGARSGIASHPSSTKSSYEDPSVPYASSYYNQLKQSHESSYETQYQSQQQPRPDSQPQSHNSLNSAAGGSKLPPYSRYSFYRYYGYAGQGAKTSWCHNLPLGQRPPYGKRTRSLLRN